MGEARRRSKELAREAVEAAERLIVDEELRRAQAHVTDPIVALGAEPSDRHSRRRRAWHQQPKRMLRDLQR